MSKKDVSSLFAEDLDRSGISKKLAEKLGFKIFTEEETAKFMKNDDFAVPSYEIPYFSIDGKRTGYSRLKILSEPKSFGKAKKKFGAKYLQRPNSAPHLYIPPNFTWKKAYERLVITEGEKKAICACEHGIACVALGGVDSFKQTKKGVFLLSEFDSLKIPDVLLEIGYDSDLSSNENVLAAMNKLAAEMTKYRPKSIHFVMLDADEEGGKQGLDDFLISHGDKEVAVKAFNALPRQKDIRLDAFAELGRELCLVKASGQLYNIEKDHYYTGAAQATLEFGPRYHVPDPENPRDQVPAIELWLKSRPTDTDVDSVIYEPGQSPRTKLNGHKLDSINLWRPSRITPEKGSADPWLELVHYVLGSDDNVKWFLKWLAYPLQKPGTKLLQAVFVYSEAQGVGKNFIVEPFISNIYGPNFKKIGITELESDFNSWAAKCQFILGDEIYMTNRRDREATMGRFNSLITSESLPIRALYRPVETFSNHAHYYLTSNHADALAIGQYDRRFMVVHAPEKPLPEADYQRLDNWAREKNGAGFVLHHLLNKVDIADFNPRAHAPDTRDKRDVIEFSMNLVQSCVRLLIDQPRKLFEKDGALPDIELLDATDILKAINIYQKDLGSQTLNLSAKSFGKYLRNTKIPARRLTIASDHRARLYAVFNRKNWKDASSTDWVRHYRSLSTEYEDARPAKVTSIKRRKK